MAYSLHVTDVVVPSSKVSKIGFNFLRSFAAPIFNFVIILIGIQHFGKVAWGEVISIQIAIFLVVFLANWGNKEFLVRQYSEQPSTMDAEFYTSLLTRSIILIGGVAFFVMYSPFLASFMLLWMFLQFTYTSTESLVVYHQKFGLQLLAETVGALLLILFLLGIDDFSLEKIVLGFAISFLVKNVIMYTKLFPKFGGVRWDKKHFTLALPFFVIGLSGWLQSKVDLYVVDYHLTNAELSVYQLFLTTFLMLQSASALLIGPFSKHIYRVENQSLGKLKMGVALAGVPMVLLGTISIYLVLELGINLGLELRYYGYGAAFALPSFWYIMDIMVLYRNKLEKRVLIINSIGAILNFILTIVLIQTLKIEGALLGIVIAQWIMLILFKLWKRNVS